MAWIHDIFKRATKTESRETGQVAALACLVGAIYSGYESWVIAAFVLLLVSLTIPGLFYPFAVVWFGLSRLLQRMMSPLLLSVIFFLVVTPVGLCRRWLGRDSLRLREFKKSRKSVMHIRNHTYTKDDLSHTF
jgi:hypothetical protein